MPFRALPSPVATFHRLVVKDRGSVALRLGEAYGDHSRQRLDLYAPRARSGSPLPVVVFFYGGSWASGRRQDYAFAGRALASRGFLAAIPDYRLVPEVRFPAFVEDAAAAVRAVLRLAPEAGGDPGRIVLAGHSAGAHLAALLALAPAWLGKDRAAVKGFAGLAGPYDFLPLTSPATQAAFSAAPRLEDTQPISFAGPGSPPALLLHGTADRTVRPRNSEALARRLTEAGADARLILYPGRSHVDLATALALPFRRRAPVLADLAAFAHEVCNPGPGG